MAGRISNELGDVIIDKEAVAKVAGLSAIECYGIVGMAMINVTSGIVKLLKRESLTKGIAVTFDENVMSFDFHIIVEYGVNITAVTDNLIDNVKYKVERFSGMKVGKIRIFVEGVRVDE